MIGTWPSSRSAALPTRRPSTPPASRPRRPAARETPTTSSTPSAARARSRRPGRPAAGRLATHPGPRRQHFSDALGDGLVGARSGDVIVRAVSAASGPIAPARSAPKPRPVRARCAGAAGRLGRRPGPVAVGHRIPWEPGRSAGPRAAGTGPMMTAGSGERLLQLPRQHRDERGRLGELAALGEQRHAVEQPRGVGQPRVVRPAASCAACSPVTSGWRGLSSRIRLTFGGSWPIARYIFSRVGVRSPGSPTRQAGEVVSRCDSRTSLTSSASVGAIQVSRSSKPCLVSSSTSSPPRSTSPLAIEASGLSVERRAPRRPTPRRPGR